MCVGAGSVEVWVCVGAARVEVWACRDSRCGGVGVCVTVYP